MNPAEELLLAILRQAIRDYIRLDPDSDTVSAEYYIDEGHDYQTAEDFLFNNVPINFGTIDITFNDICCLLDINSKKIKEKIVRNIIEY